MGLDSFSLKGRTALVTGASSGIGNGVARGLAQAGAAVVVAARRRDKLEKLVKEIEQDGGLAMAASLDVTDNNSINTALNQAQEKFGVIDIVVNNAGVGDAKHFLKMEDESYDFVMDTNVKGVWQVSQAAVRRMVDAGTPGSIVNISSLLGLRAQPGYSSYCASKGAVIQLTRAMALDLARYNIRVNAIAPGWFVTEINQDFLMSGDGQAYLKKTPARRAGEIQELVGPIILLCSEAGSFVNGVVLPVDGAHSIALI
ncbi:MAG: glucose 1-dehydrogenase [Woeseiaceae bacterium]|nr:glucose 1-dehydrogenase [Woeseiaceae bacterium]